jgi:hypothetical protein
MEGLGVTLAERSVIEPRVERHARKGLGKNPWCDTDETILLIEAMSGNELLGRTEVHISYVSVFCRQH